MITAERFDTGTWFQFVFSTGDDESEYNSLTIGKFRIRMPQWIKPWVDPSKSYRDTHAKRYGFTVFEEYVHTYFGPQTWDSLTSKCKLFEIPWIATRRVRYEFLNVDHSHFCFVADNPNGSIRFDDIEDARKRVPKVKFMFKDYDGEINFATCYLEEMEWRYGTGLFKWIGLLRKPIISRRMDLDFEKEVGPQKGSWKGGTLGHSIEVSPGESMLDAFIRYGSEDDHAKYRGKYNRGFSNIRVNEMINVQ